MKIYMSTRLLPEFKDMPRWDHFKLSRLYYLKSFLDWRHWLAFIPAIACIVLWGYMVGDFLPAITNGPVSEEVSVLLLAVLSMLAGLFYTQIVIRVIQDLYRRDKA